MGRCIFLFNKIVNIEAVVVVVKEGKSDGWIQSSSSSSGRKCEDAALPCSHFKAAPLLRLWLACVLMTLNATGINNCSINNCSIRPWQA
ncbi:hypothetical protein POTOM_038618 [Populus tomentosa]|uniref:Uncharacterized protein n=1 Tax=Populus tomentosa TaxID=118781 RepID=A0A8X7YXN3_POPTO|nr:hypothetical protein POTOM_038618 [Populus tomentosa]